MRASKAPATGSADKETKTAALQVRKRYIPPTVWGRSHYKLDILRTAPAVKLSISHRVLQEKFNFANVSFDTGSPNPGRSQVEHNEI